MPPVMSRRHFSCEGDEADLQPSTKGLGGLLKTFEFRSMQRVENPSNLTLVDLKLSGECNPGQAIAPECVIDRSFGCDLGWRGYTNSPWNILGWSRDVLSISNA